MSEFERVIAMAQQLESKRQPSVERCVELITEILYRHDLVGLCGDPIMPRDEYEPEARLLAPAAMRGEVTPELMAQVFIDLFYVELWEHSYDERKVAAAVAEINTSVCEHLGRQSEAPTWVRRTINDQ